MIRKNKLRALMVRQLVPSNLGRVLLSIMQPHELLDIMVKRGFKISSLIPDGFEFCYLNSCSEIFLKYLSKSDESDGKYYLDNGKFCRVVIPQNIISVFFSKKERKEMKQIVLYLFCKKIHKPLFAKYTMRRKRWPRKE